MRDEGILEAIRVGEARNAADPHGIGPVIREHESGDGMAHVVCNCGRLFTAATYPRAASSWRTHRRSIAQKG